MSQYSLHEPVCGLLHSHRQGISRFPQIGVVFLTFKKICTTKSKTQFFLHSLIFFRSVGKNPHPRQIGSSVAPFRSHGACLTTVECPGFGFHARLMPGFLSPLFLLSLRFTYSSAAPKHFGSAWSACTGKRAVGQAVNPISQAFAHVHIYDRVPRLPRMLCPDDETSALCHQTIALKGRRFMH